MSQFGADLQQQIYAQQQMANAQPTQPQQALQQPSPGLFSYGTQVAFGAGPGHQQKFSELSGNYAVAAIATGLGIGAATFSMGIPTFAETMRLGALSRHGVNSSQYAMGSRFAGMDFFRRGIGGFGGTGLGLGSAMNYAGTASMMTPEYGLIQGARSMNFGVSGAFMSHGQEALRASHQAGNLMNLGVHNMYGFGSQLHQGASHGVMKGRVAMHHAGMDASLGKRVHAFIAGGEQAFGTQYQAMARGETVAVRNARTLRAMQRGGLGGVNAGRFLRAARGFTGAVAGTGVGLLPAMGMMAVTEGIFGIGTEMYQGAADATMGETVMGALAPSGMNYSRMGARDFGSNLEGLGAGYGMDLNETIGTMGMLSQTGSFRGVKDMKEFRAVLKKKLTELKSFSKEIGATMEEAQQLTMGLKQSGLLDESIQSIGGQMVRSSNVTGVGLGRLQQAGQYGFQQAVQFGTDLDQGFYRYQRGVGAMNLMAQSSATSEKQRRLISLMGGPDQAAMALENQYSRSAVMAAIAMKRGEKDSEGFYKYELDQEKYDKFMAGGFSRKEIQKMMRSSKFGAQRSAFMQDEDLFSETQMQMQQQMINFANKNASEDYTPAEIMGITYGMHKNHAQMIIDNHKYKQDLDIRQAMEQGRLDRESKRTAFDNRRDTGLFSTIDVLYDKSRLGHLGRGIADSVNTAFSGGELGRDIIRRADSTTLAMAQGATPGAVQRGRDLLSGGSFNASGFGSRNFGATGAFGEAERERAYQAYHMQFGRSMERHNFYGKIHEMDNNPQVEGRDYIIGDASFFSDVLRTVGLVEDRRVIDLNAVRRHQQRMTEGLTGYREKGGENFTNAVTSFMQHKKHTVGDSAFVESSFFFDKMASASFEDDEVRALADELYQFTSGDVDLRTEESRQKAGFPKGTTLREALGTVLQDNAGAAGIDPETVRQGMGLPKDPSINYGAFTVNEMEEREKSVAQKGVTKVFEKSSRQRMEEDMYDAGGSGGRRTYSKNILHGLTTGKYASRTDSEKKIIRDAVRGIASGELKLHQGMKMLQDQDMMDEATALEKNYSDIMSKSSEVTEYIGGLDDMAIAIAYEKFTQPIADEISGGFAGSNTNLRTKGGMSQELINRGKRYSTMNMEERKGFTGDLLRSLTDDMDTYHSELTEIARSVPQVYRMHQAYQVLTDPENQRARNDLLDTLGAAQGSGKKGSYSSEAAIKLLEEKRELANFNMTDAEVKAEQKRGTPVHPREFMEGINKFTIAADKLTKAVENMPKGGPAKVETPPKK